MGDRLRVGILGTGSQSSAFLKLLSHIEKDIHIVAVASRSLDAAKKFAEKHEIQRAYGGYETLIADVDIDAVYIATCNSQHGNWGIAALESGKHVLIERPMALNAAQAQELVDVARRTGLVCMEAFGYYAHPFFKRVREIIEKGEIGDIKELTVRYYLPTLSGKNWRYNYETGGGAMMDVGVTALDCARRVLGDLSMVCKESKAKTAYPQVDQDMTAEFIATNDAKVLIDCSIWSMGPRISLVAKGEGNSEITARNWEAPHVLYNAILVTDTNGCKRTEKFETGEPSTTLLQIRTFVECIRNRDKFNESSPTNALRNMELVDSVYEKAGMAPRGRQIDTAATEAAPAQ